LFFNYSVVVMAGAAYQKSNLRELLDRFVVAQRQDIHAFCGGHLNQSNLYRPTDQAPYTNWASVGPTKLAPLAVQSQNDDKRYEGDVENMKDSLFKFALGASGFQVPKKTLEETDHVEPCGSSNYAAERLSRETSDRPRLFNSVVRQTSALLMHGKDAQMGGSLPVRSADGTSSHLCRSPAPLTQIQVVKGYRGKLESNILPGHQETVTKKDQLKKMRTFDAQVLRRSDAFQQHILTGVHAVDYLEKHLAKVIQYLL